MTKKQTYTAITLGPLFDTISKARSTKAIWAASYFFSWIMRNLMEAVPTNENCQILLPHFEKEQDFSLRAGLYPDKCIIKGDCKDELEITRKALIISLGNQVSENLSSRNKTQNRLKHFYNDEKLEEKVYSFLNEYLRINILKADIATGENESTILNEYLDTSELQSKLLINSDTDYLSILFEEVYYNFLIKERYRGGDFKYFPSTAEIATYGFNRRPEYSKAQEILRDAEGIKNSGEDNPDAQIDFYKTVRDSFQVEFRNHHKYIAIVQGDGDNFGKIIKAINGQKNAEELNLLFSEKLDQFRIKAIGTIQNWDAVPVYGSGDDLLFFAPIAKPFKEFDLKKGVVDQTVFDLLNQIDQDFEECILKCKELQPVLESLRKAGDPIPTLSFGISISYYKYPLNESFVNSGNLLFGKAKNNPGKNTLAFQVIKHSGQHFGTEFRKDSEAFKVYEKMIGGNDQLIADEKLLRSIAFKLEPLTPLLLAIGQSETEVRNKQMAHLFDEHFNETIHRDHNKELNPFLKEVLSLLQNIYQENPLKQNQSDDVRLLSQRNQQNIQKLYAALTFISFIHNKEVRDEF